MNTTAFQLGMFAYAMLFDRWANFDQATSRYLGKWEVMTDTLYRVVATQGQYVKMECFSHYGNTSKWYNMKYFTALSADQLPVAMAKLHTLMERKIQLTTRRLECELEDARQIREREANKKAFDLSANTVTRAYVHASDNGYCIETVKALVSAGHKTPTIRLVVEAMVTIPIELDGRDDYTAVRELFGQTRGDIPSLAGQSRSDDALIGRIHTELEGTNCSLKYSYYEREYTPKVVSADVEFGTPTIRPLADVQSEAPAYSGDDDF